LGFGTAPIYLDNENSMQYIQLEEAPADYFYIEDINTFKISDAHRLMQITERG
jgi:hypothetical protein